MRPCGAICTLDSITRCRILKQCGQICPMNAGTQACRGSLSDARDSERVDGLSCFCCSGIRRWMWWILVFLIAHAHGKSKTSSGRASVLCASGDDCKPKPCPPVPPCPPNPPCPTPTPCPLCPTPVPVPVECPAGESRAGSYRCQPCFPGATLTRACLCFVQTCTCA